jgi:hypothetical protein
MIPGLKLASFRQIARDGAPRCILVRSGAPWCAKKVRHSPQQSDSLVKELSLGAEFHAAAFGRRITHFIS